MQTFHSLADLTSANMPPSVRPTVEQALSTLILAHPEHYSPEDDGYVVLVEPTDTHETILEYLGSLPEHLPWEGGYRNGDILVGILLRNNQFGLTVVLPNMGGVARMLRQSLEQALC